MTDKIIYSYTRDDAIRDGVLIDVSRTAEEMGFEWPVAVTSAVWSLIVKHGPNDDVAGRLWDVLWMLKTSIKMRRHFDRDTTEVRFAVIMQSGRTKKHHFKAVSGPASPEGEPCITIMLPDED